MTASGLRLACRRAASAIAPNCFGVVRNSTMWRRAIVAKYAGCGNQPNGTSRFCFNGWVAWVSPGPPVIEDRCVAHATGKTLTTWRALRSRIARAARYGAVAAHVIPPPHGD